MFSWQNTEFGNFDSELPDSPPLSSSLIDYSVGSPNDLGIII